MRRFLSLRRFGASVVVLACVSGTGLARDIPEFNISSNESWCHDQQPTGSVDTKIRSCTIVIDSNELGPTELASAHYSRAIHRRAKGEFEAAMADLLIAIRVFAFHGRNSVTRPAMQELLGDCLRGLGRLEEALVEYREVGAFVGAGVTLYTSERFAEAAEAFEVVANNRQLKPPTRAWAQLWLFLARGRMGQDGRAAFKSAAAFVGADFLLGEPGPTAKTAASLPPGDCGGAFLHGQWHLIHNHEAVATEFLQLAVRHCRPHIYFYNVALAQLARLTAGAK